MKFWPSLRRRGGSYSPIRKTKLTGRTFDTTSPVLDIRADGHRLRALFHGMGPSHAPTLVFLHEGLGSIAQWRDFPERLGQATGCNALIYERWGHGGSDPLDGPREPDFMVREAERALPDVLDVIGVEQAILVGHSDGGTIALLFAAAHPERTLGVITLAAHVFVEPLSLDGVRNAVEAFESSDLKARLALYHGDNTERMFRGWADIWLSPKFRDWQIDDEIRAVEAPVLALQGADDNYGTPEQLRRIEAAVSGPVRTVLIPDCGHLTYRDGRETVMAEAVSFIRDIATTSSGVAEDGPQPADPD